MMHKASIVDKTPSASPKVTNFEPSTISEIVKDNQPKLRSLAKPIEPILETAYESQTSTKIANIQSTTEVTKTCKISKPKHIVSLNPSGAHTPPYKHQHLHLDQHLDGEVPISHAVYVHRSSWVGIWIKMMMV